jgi:hypothetical protein
MKQWLKIMQNAQFALNLYVKHKQPFSEIRKRKEPVIIFFISSVLKDYIRRIIANVRYVE